MVMLKTVRNPPWYKKKTDRVYNGFLLRVLARQIGRIEDIDVKSDSEIGPVILNI